MSLCFLAKPRYLKANPNANIGYAIKNCITNLSNDSRVADFNPLLIPIRTTRIAHD